MQKFICIGACLDGRLEVAKERNAMYGLFFTFIENIAYIIAFIFLGFKVQGKLMEKHEEAYMFHYKWMLPLFYSFLSLWVMVFVPFQLGDARLDLRAAPIFLLSYLGGWKFGLLAATLPAAYRIYLGGTLWLPGLTHTIILPVAAGSFFYYLYSKNKFVPEQTLIKKKELMPALSIFGIIQYVLLFWSTSISWSIIGLMVIFTILAVLGMVMMINDVSKMNLQTKKLEFLSNYDFLTHIPNRRYFKKRFNSFWQTESK